MCREHPHAPRRREPSRQRGWWEQTQRVRRPGGGLGLGNLRSISQQENDGEGGSWAGARLWRGWNSYEAGCPGSRQCGAMMRAAPEPNRVTRQQSAFSSCGQGTFERKGCLLRLPVRVGWTVLQKQITATSQGGLAPRQAEAAADRGPQSECCSSGVKPSSQQQGKRAWSRYSRLLRA